MFSSQTWLALSHPLVVATLGIAILLIWRFDTLRPRYLFNFGLAYLAYSIGVTCQIIELPSSIQAASIMFCGMMYLLAAVLLTHGVVLLSGSNYSYLVPAVIIAITLTIRAYFLFFENLPRVRFHLLHTAISLILLHGAWFARNLWKGRAVEKVLYGSFLLFGSSNAPRSLLGLTRPDNSYGFDLSLYWILTKISIYLFSIVFGVSLILTIMQRRISTHQRLSETDALTNIRNRRGFYETVTRIINRVQNYTILVADIDHFKKVNDTYGHAVGDIVLAETARIIESSIRPLDVPGRIGGEEFAIFLPDTSLEDGHKVAERLRLNFENYVFAKDHGGLKCTISLGVSVSEHYVMLVHAISRADEMLYLAKAQGRNRVVSTAPD